MDHRTNRVLETVPKSGIRKFFDVVSEMEDAVALGVGEPDFATPWNICEAAIFSIEHGGTHYTSNWGSKALRRAIAEYLETRYSVSYSPEDEILITVGASEGIDLVFRAILNPGDEVLICDPSYVSYAPAVVMAGGVAVPVPTYEADGFAVKKEAIEAKVTPKTKAIILPYPNNPTGGILEPEQVEELAQYFKTQDFFIVTDEIYAELTYTDGRHTSIASYEFLKDRMIYLSGFSKSFAMTGWRVGYACGPRDVMELMFKVHQYTMLCAPAMAQEGALEGLRKGKRDGYADVERMRREYNRRRRFIVARLNAIGLDCFDPRGAFYAYPSIKRFGMKSQDFCETLLAEQRVAIVPGDAFGPGGEGYARCSYAYSIDEITEALRRIERFVEGRKG